MGISKVIISIELENWKSFKRASLPLDKLTVLIGTNASGKSNALDALEFLFRISQGVDITAALVGDSSIPMLRGGLAWASHKGKGQFTITVKCQGEDKSTDYEYAIAIELNETSAEISSEQLTRIKYQGKIERRLRLFWTDEPEDGAPGITARLYNTKSGTKQPVRRNISVLNQLEIFPVREEIGQGIAQVIFNLRNIFILDPNPGAMRNYSRPGERLFKDGSNIAGVLVALEPKRRAEVMAELTSYAAKIPEKDIIEVSAETVDRHGIDAMLYCRESWSGKEIRDVDARGMSDGTLRFISVVVALLTRPAGSLIVIEEIDNGLHPSRAIDLLAAITEIGAERKIDVLITTHNVALLDALPPNVVRSVAVASRDPKDGASKIRVLDDLPYLSRLMADGTLGQLAVDGKIEQAVKEQK